MASGPFVISNILTMKFEILTYKKNYHKHFRYILNLSSRRQEQLTTPIQINTNTYNNKPSIMYVLVMQIVFNFSTSFN